MRLLLEPQASEELQRRRQLHPQMRSCARMAAVVPLSSVPVEMFVNEAVPMVRDSEELPRRRGPHPQLRLRTAPTHSSWSVWPQNFRTSVGMQRVTP